MENEFSSFRDPSGFVYREGGLVYRQVNRSYQEQYDRLLSSGLYDECVKKRLLVPHKEVDAPNGDPRRYKTLLPAQIPFVSYPYEWSFGQYRDAALTTLRVHRMALDKDMILKDASAYNIQFFGRRPLLIDTLSFERYTPGEPWVAYGQFCRHFLAPLMLMARRDVRLGQLMRVYIDGVPLDLAGKLLGLRGGMAAWQHIRLHASATLKHSQDGGAGAAPGAPSLGVGKAQHVALIDSLIRIVERLRPRRMQTEWGDYYDRTNYNGTATASKEALVRAFAREVKPAVVWDFGANNGHYTRIAAEDGAFAVAFDIDPEAVERNYQQIKRDREKRLLPLLIDLTNPSPSIGFAGRERVSIDHRQKPDCILALALIHHLAISNNLPLRWIAEWLAGLAPALVIEFVPKEDSQVRVLLSTRVDIFPDYTREGFERAFSEFFTIVRSEAIQDSDRTLYLMRRKETRHAEETAE